MHSNAGALEQGTPIDQLGLANSIKKIRLCEERSDAAISVPSSVLN